MKIITRLMSDILLLEPEKNGKDDLNVYSLSKSELNEVGICFDFVQENESLSGKNVLRGLHYQIVRPQGKLIKVISGSIFDAVVDLRKSSPFFGKSISFVLSEANGLFAWIPPGHAHGFYVTGNTAKVIYYVTDYRYEKFERTLLWSDPTLGLEWPIGDIHPMISEKDSTGHLFQDTTEYY
jgi:dTDP-4-dehydrorhamnose 3,5-epimerase